jgi:hypothetical protein
MAAPSEKAVNIDRLDVSRVSVIRSKSDKAEFTSVRVMYNVSTDPRQKALKPLFIQFGVPKKGSGVTVILPPRQSQLSDAIKWDGQTKGFGFMITLDQYNKILEIEKAIQRDLDALSRQESLIVPQGGKKLTIQGGKCKFRPMVRELTEEDRSTGRCALFGDVVDKCPSVASDDGTVRAAAEAPMGETMRIGKRETQCLCAAEGGLQQAKSIPLLDLNYNDEICVKANFGPLTSSTVGIGMKLKFIHILRIEKHVIHSSTVYDWENEDGQVIDVREAGSSSASAASSASSASSAAAAAASSADEMGVEMTHELEQMMEEQEQQEQEAEEQEEPQEQEAEEESPPPPPPPPPTSTAASKRAAPPALAPQKRARV